MKPIPPTPRSIGQLARHAGVGVETIRFYERQGLLEEPPRNKSGYRQYTPAVVTKLHFIKRAQELGFSLKEIADLIALKLDPSTTCAEVKQQAETKLQSVNNKLGDLKDIRSALLKLTKACRGSGPTTDCSILDWLEDD